MTAYDFANVLFGGPCNQRCVGCIGQLLGAGLTRDNRREYPLRNQELFARLLREHGVRQVVFTGTTTDPQLYDHEVRLMDWVRRQVPGVQISLHTNGQLAMAKMEILNRYDRVTLSYPSFDRATFERMTGTRRMPDLAEIVRLARIPVKVSCLVTGENAHQIGDFLARCRDMGVRRVVIRRQYIPPDEGQGRISSVERARKRLKPLLRTRGRISSAERARKRLELSLRTRRRLKPYLRMGRRRGPSPQTERRLKPYLRTRTRLETLLRTEEQIGAILEDELRLAGCQPTAAYRRNPVYDYGGMEVTYWDFARSTSTSLNLFSDGTISAEYLLIRSQKIYDSFTPFPSTAGGKAAIMEPR